MGSISDLIGTISNPPGSISKSSGSISYPALGGISTSGYDDVQWFLKQNAATYINPTLPNVMFQDFAMLPASALGDAIRITLDANSLGKTKVGFLDGTDSCTFTTPNAAALQISGSIELQFGIWVNQPATETFGVILCKDDNGGNRDFSFFYEKSTGYLGFLYSTNGSTLTGRVAMSTVALTPFTWAECKVTYNSATGDVMFYTLVAGVWTQLGATVPITSGAIHTSTVQVMIGANGNGTASNLAARVSYLKLYNGIGGALVLDMDFDTYAGSGNTFTALTGQTVTRNGTAYIAGDGYHDVAPSEATRRQRARMPHGGIRNRYAITGTTSEAFNNAKWGATETTVTDNAIAGPYAGSFASSLVPSTNNANHRITQVANQTISASGTNRWWAVVQANGYTEIALRESAAAGASAVFDIDAGTVLGLFNAGGVISGQGITALGSGWYFIYMDLTPASDQSTAVGMVITDGWVSGDPNSNSFAGDGASGVYVCRAQIEGSAITTAYQKVTAAYDITESGVPDVIWEYGAGTQYSVIQGSRNFTFLHNGLGGDAFLNAYVNKVDDAANDYFFSARITGTNVGQSLGILDATTDAGKLSGRIANGTTDIISLDSANSAVTRFDPITLHTSYVDPAYVAEQNAISVLSGNDTGTPSTAASTYDVTINAGGDGNNIMPCYIGTRVLIAGLNTAQRAQVNAFLMAQVG